MTISLTIAIVTGVLVCASVVFLPSLKLGRIRLGTYWLASLVGAIVCLFCGAVPPDYVAQNLVADTAVNPVKILALFLSMTFLSVYLDELGVFEYLADKALTLGGTRQTTLFVTLYAIVAVLTVFTSNDIVVLTFTPFICAFCRRADISPVPYLFAEFVAANTWSMCLVIGNPTNIYLATSAGIDFGSYFLTMALPTAVGGVVSFGVLWLLFRKMLASPLRVAPSHLAVSDKTQVIVGAAHLGACIVLLAVSSYIGVEMWMVSVALACSLALFATIYGLCAKRGLSVVLRSLRRLPYELIPFVLSMFVLVLALNYNGDTMRIAGLLAEGHPVWTVGGSAFVAANVVNNIPMSVLYSAIVDSGAIVGSAAKQAVFAAVAASNIGAYLTPVGALAGIMWLGILKKEHVPIGFGTFVKYGVAVAVPALAATLGVLCLVVR